jgi:hypothetical protein
LELISRIPASSENRVVDAATRARKLTTRAALKAATISGSLALPPGPLGLVTVLPDLYAVWRVQAQLVSDIAAVHGQTAFLSRELMAWCLFRHAATQAVRDVVTRVGERVVVNSISLLGMETVLTKIGMAATQRVLEKGAARFIPLGGAVGVAVYAYRSSATPSRRDNRSAVRGRRSFFTATRNLSWTASRALGAVRPRVGTGSRLLTDRLRARRGGPARADSAPPAVAYRGAGQE